MADTNTIVAISLSQPHHVLLFMCVHAIWNIFNHFEMILMIFTLFYGLPQIKSSGSESESGECIAKLPTLGSEIMDLSPFGWGEVWNNFSDLKSHIGVSLGNDAYKDPYYCQYLLVCFSMFQSQKMKIYSQK